MNDAELPSQSSANDLINGVDGALPRVVAHTLGRALLIGLPIAIVGAGANTLKFALAGAIGIEFFVLGFLKYKQLENSQCLQSSP